MTDSTSAAARAAALLQAAATVPVAAPKAPKQAPKNKVVAKFETREEGLRAVDVLTSWGLSVSYAHYWNKPVVVLIKREEFEEMTATGLNFKAIDWASIS